MAAAAREAEAQAVRWFLWAPVAFGGGAATYFALRDEPPGWTAGLALVAVAIAAAAARWGRRGPLIAALLIAFFAGGFAAAQLRTWSVSAPVLSGQTRPATIEGWVVDVASPGAGGPRLVIAPMWISGLRPYEIPRRIRVTVDHRRVYGPGAPVRLMAILNPSPGPAAPGAYDFARDAFFERIGGVGFTVREPELTNLPPPAEFGLRLQMRINAFRWSLSRRIVERMGVREGGVAAAMTTGHEAWLERPTLDAMRDSGLAHVLSISGLHMAVVGGFVFFAVRAGLAAWPWAALRLNVKKLAAAAGMAAVAGYLLISGAPPPAERAAITATVAFLAVLLDRRAISLRALAIAALAVLVLQPEAVVQPGFQMSFAATTALIALAERWPRPIREMNVPWPIVAVQRAVGWIVLAAAISFVAGVATGPFAVQHFNRMANFGLVANVVTAPLSTLAIMPALATGAALELFGLGGPFLAVAGWGIGAMLWVAETVSSLPGAVRTIAAAPAVALPVAFLGLLWLCLWDGRLRWLGAPFALAVLLWPRPEPPVGWIAEEGANVALARGGQAAVMRPQSQAFAFELWARRRGFGLAPAAPAWRCERRVCRSLGPRPVVTVALTRRVPRPEAWRSLCEGADLIILQSNVAPPRRCSGALVLGPPAFARGGSAEIVHEDPGWRVIWSNAVRGRRPWTGA